MIASLRPPNERGIFVTTATATERKAISLELKGDAPRSFSAVISTPHVDRDGDRVLTSAFQTGQRVPVLVSHGWDSLPVGAGTIQPTAGDVRLHGAFFDTDQGRAAYETAKQLGQLAEFSIGFRVLDSEWTQHAGRNVREIRSLELFEVSLVVKGAAYGTGLLDIKSPRRGFDDLDGWLRDLGSDDELSVKSLSRRAFDVQEHRGAKWLEFKGSPLWPAAVAEAERDDDSFELKTWRNEFRATASPEYAPAFWLWLTAAGQGTRGLVGKALMPGTDSMGGFLVPPELRAAVERQRDALSIVRPRAAIFPTIRDQLILPRAALVAGEETVWSSQIAAERFGPGRPLPEGSAAFDALAISITNLGVELKPSMDLWQDSDSLEAFLVAGGAEALAQAENRDFLVGAGLVDGMTGTPVGLFYSDAPTAVIGAPTAAGVKLVVETLPGQWRDGSVWIMSEGFEADVRDLTAASSNVPLYARDANDGRIENRPVVVTPWTVSGQAALANLRGYAIADRQSLSVRVLQELYGRTHQVGVHLIARNGGGLLHRHSAVIGTAA
jgi:HK97 family phage major capsid protein/HK97 family phage prohead protease